MGKHGHENQKRTKRSQRIKAKARKSKTSVKSSQRKVNSWSTEVNHYKTKPHNNPIPVPQRDPEAPALSLINQDLLYLKKGNSGPEKIVLSLHKFPAIIFNDVDIEERTSRWVNKCVKKFNPYARYGVEHWKNPHAKIFYIKRQKEPGKPKEVVYSNSKIIQVIKTYWELGHEHKFITEIVARRANECIVSITESDYKNLNKNDIEDIYLLIMNGKVPDYAETGLLWSLSVFIRSSVIWERVHDFQLGIESYQQKVNLTAPTISFPGIEKHKMFSIIYEPVHGIIYKNSKKEKRVMRHSEIHKFCDATLNRVLEGLKSYNNDVKYGYKQRDLTEDEVEYLKLFEEEIEVRLKYHNQMRRWEIRHKSAPHRTSVFDQAQLGGVQIGIQSQLTLSLHRSREVGAVPFVSPTGVLDLVDYSSSSDSDPSEDSLPLAPDLPLVSPFLCSDDSEVDVGPIPARRLAWRCISHHSRDHHSSPDSSSSGSPLDHSLSGHTPPDTTDADTSTPLRFVHRSLAKTPRCSEALRRWRSAPLSTPYPPTTSESSLVSSFERSLDSSPPSFRLSRKRCRFRDSYSPEDSGEEHMEVDTANAEAVADVGISD
ncbi:hypothetical protein Tco_0291922 [Tanacetum coccineum]